jgi:ABC-type transporter Mla maintaining outer membrane lipid asymmetry permease subunit MlaE
MMLKLYTLLATLHLTPLSGTAAGGFTFNPQNFVDNLKYMGVGMLAIFIVIGVIVGITYLLNSLFCDKSK